MSIATTFETVNLPGVTLYRADCLDVLPTLGQVDVVVTDPPYPDYHVALYQQTDIAFLNALSVKQLIFWSAKTQFQLSYSAIHIWDKKTGCGSQYERIFERNGSTEYRVYRHYLINSIVAASYTGDVFTGHASQKPIALMLEVIKDSIPPGALVLDPFMGSGTTGVACVRTGRRFIGIELDPTYFAIAVKRITEAQLQPALLPVDVDTYQQPELA